MSVKMPFLFCTGILLRNGYWFDLEYRTWEAQKFPPNNVLVDEPNSAFGYQGKLTIFGNPVCNSTGECRYTEVVQHNPGEDTWLTLGHMTTDRRYHEVVEVPVEFCDVLGTIMTTTEAPTTTEDPAITDEPLPGEDSSNVAMIIGGIWEEASGGSTLPSVELFGCPGYQNVALPVEDYPTAIYLTAGQYMEDENKVLVCGGFTCEDQIGCRIITDCYEWMPELHWQEATASLNERKWSHIMASAVNVDLVGDDEHYPLVLGGTDTVTEMYDPVNDEWYPYYDLPEGNWRSIDCLVQYGDDIYHINTAITKLDTLSWSALDLGEVPEFISGGGRCSMVRIKGHVGE